MDTDETGKPVDTKGHFGRECGRLLCHCSPANWHDGATFVCDGCAEDENRREWRNRSDGSPCCVFHQKDPDPKSVPITGYYEDAWDMILP